MPVCFELRNINAVNECIESEDVLTLWFWVIQAVLSFADGRQCESPSTPGIA